MRSQSFVQSQTYRTIPVQIQANSILNMNIIELQQFVENEVIENPAMTLKEGCRCPVCGFFNTAKFCPVCGASMRVPSTVDYGSERDYLRKAFESAGTETFFDPFRTIAAPFDLKAYLRQQLGMILTGRKQRIADYIIDCLDDDGYFREPMFDTAELMATAVPEVEEVLGIIQRMDPPGIAARDLQECLLLQIPESGDEVQDLARRILVECWDEFSKMKSKAIASAFHVSLDDVCDALDYIRESLNPYPASEYRDPNESFVPADSTALIPDVIVKERDGVLFAEVVDAYDSLISTDETYESIYNSVKENGGRFCEDDQKHVREHVDRVKFILESIQLRKKTLGKVAQYLVDFQEEYIRLGASKLKPLRQKDVAEYLEVHESTISRALAGKYLRLPSGDVISFEVFFDSALPIRDMIGRIVADSNTPLSDSDIARKLAENGINIARRTVAKYREQMKMLPVQLRSM